MDPNPLLIFCNQSARSNQTKIPGTMGPPSLVVLEETYVLNVPWDEPRKGDGCHYDKDPRDRLPPPWGHLYKKSKLP